MGLLIVIYIVFISLGLPDSLFGVSWPVVHLELQMPEGFASILSVIIGLCTSGASFVAGKLIRKFGTGKVTFFSTLLTVLGLVGISFAPNIFVLILFSVVLGYGAGAIDTGLNNYVSLHYKAQHMNWLHCFWGVGVTLSPMIMSAFLGGDGSLWRDGYRVVALLQLAIAMVVLLTLKKWNTHQPEQEEKKAPDKSFRELMKAPGMAVSILSLGLYCAGESVLGTWGATYAVNTLSLAPEVAAKWVSLYYGGIMVGRVVSGFVSMKVSDNGLIRIGVIAAALGMGVLALPLGEMSLLGLFLIGFGYGPIFPSVIHSVPARFGAEYSADITGYHMGGAYTISMVAQMTFGLVASATTFAITPYVLLALIGGVWVATVAAIRAIK